MSHQAWQMGSAPEICQARMKELAALNPEPEVAPEVPPETPAEPAPEVVEETVDENPAYESLEMLPDDDLKALAAKNGIEIDGRWGRKRVIQALAASGISG